MSHKKLAIIATAIIIFASTNLAEKRNLSTQGLAEKSNPILQLDVTPENECQDYCKYENECKTLSFNLDRLSECSLYQGERSRLIYETNNTSHFALRMKDCDVSKWPDINKQNQFNSSKSLGVFQSSDSKMCVEVNFTEIDQSTRKGYQLFWSSNCEAGQKWEIIPLGQGKVSGCDRVKVKVEGGNMCLSVVKLELYSFSPTAVLQACTNGSEGNDMSQMILLCRELSVSRTESVWSLRPHLPVFYSIILPINSSFNWESKISPSTVNILAGLKLLNNIPCKEIIITDGRMLPEEKVPFFLPGGTITVSCNKGFGIDVAKGISKQEFTTTCLQSVSSQMREGEDIDVPLDFSDPIQIASKSSESSMTVNFLVILKCVSNFLMSL